MFEISRISEGGMRDAISMLDQVLSYSEGMVTLEDVHEVNGTLSQKDLGEFIENIFDKNILEVLKLIDKYNDLGKNIIKLSEEIIQLLKNILLYKTVPNYFDDKELEALYERLGNNTKVEQLINLIDEFNNSLPKLKQSNDPKLILELLVIKYISTNNEIKVQNSEQIIDKKQEVSSKIEQRDKIKKEKVKKETRLEQKEEKKIQENKTLEKTDEFHKKIDELKNIRINNTLAEFNKQHFLFIKEELDNIKDMLLNPDYSEFVSTILDGTLKAASDKNLIFVYNTDTLSNYFNENLLIIEEILENNYNKHYDAIAVDNISWEIIKKEFNSKSKLYVYQKETIDIKDLFSSPKESDELNDLFGEIIEIVN